MRRTDVHHAPWPLQLAEAEIEENSMISVTGLDVTGPPEVLHYASAIEVVNWLPERIEE